MKIVVTPNNLGGQQTDAFYEHEGLQTCSRFQGVYSAQEIENVLTNYRSRVQDKPKLGVVS